MMQIINNVSDLKNSIEAQKKDNKCIGFVPTMGALHSGHISLVNKASIECDFIIVSIFVNPTQFNDITDLERYPRTLDADIELLNETACDIVFVPSVETMYPEPDNRKFNFGSLEAVMEGSSRPGHFNGVAQVVSKLFEMITPNKAFFGQKDFQQLAIIRLMAKQLKMPIEIISCPIIRENSGLAMSSRNKRLNNEQIVSASKIYSALCWARDNYKISTPQEIKIGTKEIINSENNLKVEYVEISDGYSLQPIEDWSQSQYIVMCVAVYCGDVRLIDNIILK